MTIYIYIAEHIGDITFVILVTYLAYILVFFHVFSRFYTFGCVFFQVCEYSLSIRYVNISPELLT